MFYDIQNTSLIMIMTRRDDQMSGAFWEIVEFGPHGFEPWSSQMNDLEIDTCRVIIRCLALLG